MDAALPPPPPFDAAPEGAFRATLASLAAFDATGADARDFLQGQLSSDVKALAVGEGQYASYNSPKGRMLATLVVWRREAERFTLVAAADLAEVLARRIGLFVLRAKVAWTPRRSPLVGLGGTAAWQAAGIEAAFRSGADGATLALPDGRALVDAPALPTGLAALPEADESTWRWLGVRAGVPVVTEATREALIAQSANWELVGGVDFRKGCYPGQEIIARMQYLGRLKERLQGFHVAGHGTAVPAAGAPVTTPGRDEAVGTVVNAEPAPGGGTDLLAVVRVDAQDVPLFAAGAALEARRLPYAVTAIENQRVRL